MKLSAKLLELLETLDTTGGLDVDFVIEQLRDFLKIDDPPWKSETERQEVEDFRPLPDNMRETVTPR